MIDLNLKKEDIVCAFHEDFEKKVCRIDKRVFWIMVLLGANLLANGVNILNIISKL